jgi:hypothetical protein
MRFPRFWHRPASDSGAWSTTSRAWRDSGLADEVEAFLTGRLVDHLSGCRQPVPAWAALNRLAHADRDELRNLVERGGELRVTHPSFVQPQWMATERFIAGQVLARSGTAEALARIQRTMLIPLELQLIEWAKIEPLTEEQVLQAGAQALDTYRSGR